jgi:hypothetical protein
MPEIDQDRLMALVQQCVGDLGAMLSGTLVNVGDKLWLYRALAQRGPLTPQELAQATGASERSTCASGSMARRRPRPAPPRHVRGRARLHSWR